MIVPVLLFVADVSAAEKPGDDQLITYLNKHGRPPAQYIVDLFKTADVVLLAEDHAVRQHLDFVADLIPVLYEAGIYHLGMEFGAAEDQPDLDALITNRTFDEDSGRQIMFNYNPVWSWKEYRNLYKAAWRLNQTLSPGQVQFRIINISYRYDWTQFDGIRSPETMKKVFHKGTIDKFRAEIVEREVLDRGQKILLLVGLPHAFTRFTMPEVHFNKAGFCGFDDQWLGNRLYKDHGSKITNILFHQPFRNRLGLNPSMVQPAQGELQRILKLAGGEPVGFNLRFTPLGALPDSSKYSTCRPNFTLGDFFDSYIFIAPFNSLSAATPDLQFVNSKNAARAIEQFPDPDWFSRPNNLDELKAHIKKMATGIDAKYQSVK